MNSMDGGDIENADEWGEFEDTQEPGVSEFWFRGYRIAFFRYAEFEFDCGDKEGLPNCNMPSWKALDLLLFSEWIKACVLAFQTGKPLPDNVELN